MNTAWLKGLEVLENDGLLEHLKAKEAFERADEQFSETTVLSPSDGNDGK